MISTFIPQSKVCPPLVRVNLHQFAPPKRVAPAPISKASLEPELLTITDEQRAELTNAQTLLAPHRSTGRGNPLYFLFKLLASGCLKFARYHPSQATLGQEIEDYGYNKTLEPRQIRRLWTKLQDAQLFTAVKLGGKIYEYQLTELGTLAWHVIVQKNQGRVQVEAPPPDPVKSGAMEKCPQSETENVRTYIEPLYSEYTSTYITGFESQRLSLRKKNSHIRPLRLSGEKNMHEDDIRLACQQYELDPKDYDYVIRHMQSLKSLERPSAYLAKMIKSLIAGTWDKGKPFWDSKGDWGASKRLERTQSLIQANASIPISEPPKGLLKGLKDLLKE